MHPKLHIQFVVLPKGLLCQLSFAYFLKSFKNNKQKVKRTNGQENTDK